MPWLGAEALCSAYHLQRDQSTLSSAKGGVEGLLGGAGPPHTGREHLAQINLRTQSPKDTTTGWSETLLGKITTKAQPLLLLTVWALQLYESLHAGSCEQGTVGLDTCDHKEGTSLPNWAA